KALGGGLPLGAVMITEEVASALAPGMHGCTFGGGAVAATAALWTLERIRSETFLRRVRRRAARLGKGIRALAERHAAVRGVRGRGPLLAIDLEPGHDPAVLVSAARARGLLLVRGGERAVRLLPPLTVSEAEIDEALERLDAALGDLVSSP